jgi:hypothetical protein
MKFFTNQLNILPILPCIEAEHDFNFIRHRLLIRQTITEHEIAKRIAKTDTSNQLPQIRFHPTSKWKDNLIIHYTHEERFATSKRDIHRLWDQLFQTTPVATTKLIIGNRNSPNIMNFIVHRRPQYKSPPIQNDHQNHKQP